MPDDHLNLIISSKDNSINGVSNPITIPLNNIGNNSNGANLVKVTLKGAQMGAIQIEGMTDINGTYKQGFAPSASALDGAQIHMIRRSGILLKDPLSCGELIPAQIGKFVN